MSLALWLLKSLHGLAFDSGLGKPSPGEVQMEINIGLQALSFGGLFFGLIGIVFLSEVKIPVEFAPTANMWPANAHIGRP